YFGPDVDSPQKPQQPGSLEGLAIGLPFFALPAPEAPFVLLNLLSFASLCAFAWYCSRRLPEVPAWIIWGWLLTAPWTLNFSTHIVNISYLLPASLIFFMAAVETLPALRKGLLAPALCYFLMGLALFWVAQFHMSWVLLPPYAVVSLCLRWRARGFVAALKSFGWFALGCALTGSLLMPTFLRYGWVGGMGGTQTTVGINWANLRGAYNLPEGIMGRFLSFASFELPRFLGSHTPQRLAFFAAQPWLAPFGLLLFVVGILQPVVMLLLWFTRREGDADWRALKYFTLASLSLLYLLFLFAAGKPPAAHTYYVMLPVAMLYAFYCWSPYLRRRGWQIFAFVLLVCGIIFHAGLALHRRTHDSMYTNRAIVRRAIDERDYRILGERREGSRY
ncbi:MAG: hypothetical protein ACJ741_17680, partial [Pyrinomonadaceae bacterium]